MTRSFCLISLCLIVLLSACSSSVSLHTSANKPLFDVSNGMSKFNIQINFKKQSFSGMLIVQRRTDCEIRIVATTYFGPTLFDFGLKDGEFIVYNCIEPMRNKNLMKLFENDFKQLFLSNRKFRKIRLRDGYEERISGRNFGKSVFLLYNRQNNDIENLTIKHPWIGITIQLNKLPE